MKKWFVSVIASFIGLCKASSLSILSCNAVNTNSPCTAKPALEPPTNGTYGKYLDITVSFQKL